MRLVRNDVARKRIANEPAGLRRVRPRRRGIVDLILRSQREQFREVPGAHLCGRDAEGGRRRHLERVGFEVGEVERAAPGNRPADGSAEAVVVVVALRAAGLLVEIVRRIEVRAAEPFVDLAAQCVGAALGHEIHRRAHRVADGRVVGRRLDAELLDRRRRRAVGDAIRGDVGDAVDGEVVPLLAGAVARPLRQAVVEGGFAGAKIGGVLHARRQDHELDRGAFTDRAARKCAGHPRPGQAPTTTCRRW